jgi:enoyl-CoA hydratase
MTFPFPAPPNEIKFEVVGPVATVTLNRPQKLNTMTPAMGKALLQIVFYVNNTEGIRVVILTGTGTKAFSAGSDVKVLDDYGSNWQLRNRTDYARELWKIKKPVIAKIRGYCIGGGLEMALMCDIRYSTSDAKFGAGEIKLGWHGGAGNTQLLPRFMSTGRAMEMLLTGDMISAAEAERSGLVDRIVNDDELDQKVAELAVRIASNAPIASQLAKHLVRVSMSTAVDVGLAYENDTFSYCLTTEDSQEGKAAFVEKRAPHFQGR